LQQEIFFMQTAKKLGSLALLVPTWLFLLFTLTLFTELIMAPWDTAIHLPEVGTWQRTLNDFFDFSFGQFLISLPVVLVSIAVTVAAYRSRSQVLPRLVIGNALLAVSVWLLVMLASAINNQILYPYPSVLYDPNYRGYHLSILPMFALLSACAVWFIWQRRLAKTFAAT